MTIKGIVESIRPSAQPNKTLLATVLTSDGRSILNYVPLDTQVGEVLLLRPTRRPEPLGFAVVRS